MIQRIEVTSDQALVLETASSRMDGLGYQLERSEDGTITALIDPRGDLKRRFILFGYGGTSAEETKALSERGIW